MFLTMMTPLVYLAVRNSVHREDAHARPVTDDHDETLAHPASATVRHRPNLMKARRRSWLSRHNVPQTHLP